MFILLNFQVNVQLDVIYARKLTISNMLEKTLKIVFDRSAFHTIILLVERPG